MYFYIVLVSVHLSFFMGVHMCVLKMDDTEGINRAMGEWVQFTKHKKQILIFSYFHIIWHYSWELQSIKISVLPRLMAVRAFVTLCRHRIYTLCKRYILHVTIYVRNLQTCGNCNRHKRLLPKSYIIHATIYPKMHIYNFIHTECVITCLPSSTIKRDFLLICSFSFSPLNFNIIYFIKILIFRIFKFI